MKTNGLVYAGLFIFLASTAAKLLIYDLSNSMYNLTFEVKGKEITVQVDEEGVIRRATEDEAKWKEQVVIGIKKLKEGDVVKMYNLLTDAMIPESEFYRVIHIRHDTGIF